MNFRKRGITLVSTLIMLVVITLLAGTITISTNYIIEDTYKKEFMREYKLVEATTKDYIMRNSGVVNFTEATLDISNINEEYKKQFDGEKVVDNKIDIYVIDLEK